MAKLRISEIFTSIQGEGSWVGVPSTFVRVSGCNLRCTWCDTPYASWEPEGPTLEVVDVVEKLADAAKHIVVTGGEPMLFDATEELCRQLKARGHIITIETAGTIYRDISCDLMSISPKLSNSTPFLGQITSALDRIQTGSLSDWPARHEETRANVEALVKLIASYAHQLKFVVNPDVALQSQMDEILVLLSQVGAQASNVLLMAEGTDSETLHRRERLLVETCLGYGFRLTPRLHVDLFGNARGT